MSYDNKHYREYALIQGINLLVNMVEQVKIGKADLKDIYPIWINSGILSFGAQIELIFGTAADELRCRYLSHCLNELNTYMLSKYPKHIRLIKKLTSNILEAINMAVTEHAHIWSKAQIQAIQTAFSSGRVAKTYYISPKEVEEDEEKKKKKRKYEDI